MMVSLHAYSCQGGFSLNINILGTVTYSNGTFATQREHSCVLTYYASESIAYFGSTQQIVKESSIEGSARRVDPESFLYSKLVSYDLIRWKTLLSV